MRALGEEFRAAREARGLSLSDVAEQIHIRSVYLQALESEDWPTIGAPVYVRGFIRTYARFLGIDAESAVQRFNESGSGGPGQGASPPGREASEQGRRSRPSPFLWAAGTLALLLVAAVVYKYLSLQMGSRTPVAVLASPAAAASPGGTPVAEAASAEPEASPSPSPSPSPSSTKTLTVHLSQESWLRVVVDGHNDMEGLFPPGTVRTFHGNVADVRIGNAGGVDLDVNGKDLGKLGNSGDVVERRLPLGGE